MGSLPCRSERSGDGRFWQAGGPPRPIPARGEYNRTGAIPATRGVTAALLDLAPSSTNARFDAAVVRCKHVPSPSLDSLNASQRLAATHVEGPLLVLAGPGSGKTRVVTHRIAHLISVGVPASQIVALSFTNKAADEMRRRVAELVGQQPVEMGTFHRFAARLLRYHARLVGLTSDYSILDQDDAVSLMKRAAKKLGLSLSHTPIERLAGVISRAKNDLFTPDSFEPRWGRPAEEVALRLWPIYQDMLLQANSVDFDDLLVHVARLLTDHPDLRALLDARHRWILVDEYQDTNAVQYCILRGLSIDHPNLSVTGDPDQAIYGWRGASIRNILEFERDYPAATVVKLEHNYRSTANILGTADRLIAHNSRRKPKRLITDAAPGLPVRIVLDSTSHEEAERIADEIAGVVAAGRSPRDIAILFRTNALSRSLEVALRARGVPYQLVRGLEFFQRREVRDVVAWLRLLKNPRDDEAMLRVVNVPPRGIGRQSLERLAAWAEDRRVSRLEAAAQAGLVPGLPKRAVGALERFARLHGDLGDSAREAGSRVAPLLEAVLDRTGYRRMLADDEDENGEDRLANIEELVTAALQFDRSFVPGPDGTDPLGGFLETTALVGDTDAWDAASERVSLMTFHAAKGLEFPIVYLVAMEDGILPHERSLDQPDQLEEERRLVFVGITRGREEVNASCARMRDYRGSRRISAPSLFLAEMSGRETVVGGAESPSLGGPGRSFEPLAWDDAAQEAPEHDGVDPGPPFDCGTGGEPPRVMRQDGLVLELDDMPADKPAPRRSGGGARRSGPTGDAGFVTAAELARRLDGRQPVGRAFRNGQRVRHAEYGDGLIVGISGTGPRSVGTVLFDGPAGTRKFILGHGALEPAE
ncbi:MAG: AAA family ATPase [Planctomycetia bacterium]|nr:AAA family ATPase [Planctomycetia bacterium]